MNDGIKMQSPLGWLRTGTFLILMSIAFPVSSGVAKTAPVEAVIAFVFGLLHDVGFAEPFAEIGLPQHALPSALLVNAEVTHFDSHNEKSALKWLNT